MPENNQFGFLDQVQDITDDFIGLVVGISHFLNGCTQYLVQGPSKDGVPGKAAWVDSQQLVLLNKATKEVPQQPTGGPRQEVDRSC